MLDDRGQPVRVLNPAGFTDWPVQGDARIAALVRRIGLAIRGGGLRNTAWSIVHTVLTIGAAVAVLSVVQRLVPGLPGWVNLAGILAVGILCGRLLMRARTRGNEAALADLIAAEGLCPRCGYNFVGLVPEHDGCFVCPECSAAWHERRVIRTLAFATGAKESNILAAVRSGASSGDAWTTIDDRGRRVELVHPRLRRPLNACPGGELRRRLLAARDGFAHDARWVRRPILALLWPVVLGVSGLGVVIAIAGNVAASSVLFAAVGCLLLAVFATFGNFAYSPRKVRSRMLRSHLCPSCAADLADEPPDDVGLRVCRGCTSAWRLPDQETDQVDLSTNPLS